MKNDKIADFVAKLKNGAHEILLESELISLLEKKEKLTVKAGFDPSTSKMHLGHLVLLNKLKLFQDYGHKVIFLIGNFTGMIGDPTGKNVTRKTLTEEQVQINANSYQKQIFNILDREKTIVEFNGDWLKKLTLQEVFSLLSKYTIARILERDDFKSRYKNKQSISMHEFVYPLLQGYDSVHLNADVEIGGTDQKFNLLVGRELQKKYGKKQQIIITLPLLEGTDGKNKMSKSLNNSIDISDDPNQIFGKLMSINDKLMFRYYELILNKTEKEIKLLADKCYNGKDIKDMKLNLAFKITKMITNEKTATIAKENFESLFKKKHIPSEIDTLEINSKDKELKLYKIMRDSSICNSNTQAIKLIKQNAVKLDNRKILNYNYAIKKSTNAILQVGKRKFLRIKIKFQ